jgi:hypothetical protein
MVIESLFSNLSADAPRREFQVSVAGKGGGFSATRALHSPAYMEGIFEVG